MLKHSELAALGLAHRDEQGRHCSEGHRVLIVQTRWHLGEGKRYSLDVLLSQLREVHADVTPQCLSAILNRRRMPSLFLIGAFHRAFYVAVGSWIEANREPFPAEEGKRAVDRDFVTAPRERGRSAA